MTGAHLEKVYRYTLDHMDKRNQCEKLLLARNSELIIENHKLKEQLIRLGEVPVA